MKMLLRLLFLLPITAAAQDSLTVSAHKTEYAAVIQVDSATAQNIYSRAKIFVAGNSLTDKDEQIVSDDNSLTVTGKGIMRITYKGAVYKGYQSRVRFQITIDSKDNRYRYLINNFYYYTQLSGPDVVPLDDEKYFSKHKKQWEYIIQQVDKTIANFISNMKATMSQPDNW
jgi:lipopolysaccharide export system protein LptA